MKLSDVEGVPKYDVGKKGRNLKKINAKRRSLKYQSLKKCIEEKFLTILEKTFLLFFKKHEDSVKLCKSSIEMIS